MMAIRQRLAHFAPAFRQSRTQADRTPKRRPNRAHFALTLSRPVPKCRKDATYCGRTTEAPVKVNGHHRHEMSGAVLRHATQAPNDTTATSDAAVQVSAPGPASPAAAPVNTAAPAPVESTVDMAARKLPPGLARVAARFEAMGSEARSGGQSNALQQITRNLQRYIETQGLATPPAPLPAVPVVLPAISDSSTDTVAPAVMPSDSAHEPTGAATHAVVELAGPVRS
jgi:hypothetical protein